MVQWRPPRSPQERNTRAIRSMTPGSLDGRIVSASPIRKSAGADNSAIFTGENATVTDGDDSISDDDEIAPPIVVPPELPPAVAPTSSPATTVVPFGVREIKATWPLGDDPTLVYDVYIKSSSGVTTADELVGTAAGGWMIIATLGGTPLSASSDTYVAVVAKNSAGSAPIGAEGFGRPRTAGTGDIDSSITDAITKAQTRNPDNIVPDPTFNSTGLWHGFVGSAIEPTGARNGGPVLHGTTSPAYAFSALTRVEPGATYRGTFSYKTAASLPAAYLQPVATYYAADGTTIVSSGSFAINSGATVAGAWEKLSGQFVVPSNAAYVSVSPLAYGDILWDEVFVTRMAESSLIVDGSIVATDVATHTLTADQIKATSIDITRMTVGSTDNIVGDPTFLTPLGQNWVYGAGTVTLTSNTSRKAGPALRLANASYVTSAAWLPIEAGASVRLSAYIKPAANIAANSFSLLCQWRNAAGTITNSTDVFNPALLSGSYSLVAGIVTAPLGTVDYRMAILNTSTGTTVDIDFASITRASQGELIVDGTITSNKIKSHTINADNIDTDYIYAGDIEAGQITGGTLKALVSLLVGEGIGAGGFMTLSPPSVDLLSGELIGGLVVGDPANPGGEPLIRLHPNGSIFNGQLTAQILTVLQDFRVNGVGHLSSGSSLIIENGVSSPTEGPALSSTTVSTAWPAIPAGYSERGICWDSTNTQWWQLLWRSSNNRGYIRTISTAGVPTPVVTLDNDPDLWGGLNTIWGIAYLSGSVYVGAMRQSYPGYAWSLDRHNPTTGARTAYISTSTELSAYATAFRPGVGTDGSTYVYFSIPRTDTPTSSTVLYRLQASLVSSTGDYCVFDRADTGLTEFIKYIGIGSYDLGATKLVISDGTNVRTYDNPTTWQPLSTDEFALHSLYPSAPKVPAYAGKDWTSTSSSWLTYKSSGSNIAFYSSKGDGKLERYSGYFATGGELWWAQYLDTGTGIKHTAVSPESDSLALAPRRYAAVTLRPTITGVTGAEVWVGYGTSSPGATKYKRAESLTGRTMVLTDGKQTTGTPVVRTVTNKVLASNVATLTTSVAHGLVTGDTVTVAGVDATFNGSYVIASTPTTTTFTYARTAANVGSTASSGTVTPYNTFGGSPATLQTEIGGMILKGDGTGSWPLMDEIRDYGTVSVTSLTSGYTGTINLRRIGKMVFVAADIVRASSFNSSYHQVATIPSGFKPSVNTTPGATPWSGTTDTYQLSFASSGVVNIRESAARNITMSTVVSWVTDDPAP